MEESKKESESKDVEMAEEGKEAGDGKAEGGDAAKSKQQAQKDKDLLTFEGKDLFESSCACYETCL